MILLNKGINFERILKNYIIKFYFIVPTAPYNSANSGVICGKIINAFLQNIDKVAVLQNYKNEIV